jgi:hypothetical protein
LKTARLLALSGLSAQLLELGDGDGDGASVPLALASLLRELEERLAEGRVAAVPAGGLGDLLTAQAEGGGGELLTAASHSVVSARGKTAVLVTVNGLEIGHFRTSNLGSHKC